MKKLENIIINLLIALLFLLLAAVLLSKLVFHIEMKAVLTGSMEPDLPVGSLLIISPADYENIAVGDDITFVRDANLTLVTHRVISKDDASQEITTQGIANNVPDNPTSYANVVGKVMFHIPYAGYLVIWTSDLKSKVICCIMIAALVVVSLLFEEKKEPKIQQKYYEQGEISDESESTKNPDGVCSPSADSGSFGRRNIRVHDEADRKTHE